MYPTPNQPSRPLTQYESPDTRAVGVFSNMGVLFSDDFGGTAIDKTKWQTLSGGYAGIGSGTNVGMTSSVASSALTVNMNTTNGDELWFLSQQTFAGTEDLIVTLSKSQSISANSIFIGLVEVDSAGNPKVNPNLAGSFNNLGGAEFAATTTNTLYTAQAVGDGSPSIASGSAGTAAALTAIQEFCFEFHAEDIIISTQAVDSLAGKLSTPSRVSSQCPSDGVQYKLLMRFKNTSAPGSNTVVTVGRVLVVDCQELRAEITSGRGDQIVQKALPVNVVSEVAAPAGTNMIGDVGIEYRANATGAASTVAVMSPATPAATVCKAGAGRLVGGFLQNSSAAIRSVKFWNTAQGSVTLGTTAAIFEIDIPAGGYISFTNTGGLGFTTAITYAVTGAKGLTDNTGSLAANDVSGFLAFA